MVNTKDDIVDKLRAPYGRLTRAMREDAACEIDRSRARIAELEAALKPFADKCEYLEGMYPPYENDDWTELTMDCLRAARAALEKKDD